jgi:tetratricopeptide (TPR) repeat protein
MIELSPPNAPKIDESEDRPIENQDASAGLTTEQELAISEKMVSAVSDPFAPAIKLYAEGRQQEAKDWVAKIGQIYLNRQADSFLPSKPDNNSQSVPPALRARYEEALRSFDQGSIAESIALFALLVAAEGPLLPAVMFNLGVGAIHLGYPDEAIQFLRRVQRHSANWASLRWNLTVAYYRKNELDSALENLNEQVASNTKDYKAAESKSYLQFRMGKPAQAFETALALRDARPHPPLWTAVVFFLARKASLVEMEQKFADEIFGAKEPIPDKLSQPASISLLPPLDPNPPRAEQENSQPLPTTTKTQPQDQPSEDSDPSASTALTRPSLPEFLDAVRALANGGTLESAAEAVVQGVVDGICELGDVRQVLELLGKYETAVTILEELLDRRWKDASEDKRAILQYWAFLCACERGEDGTKLLERINAFARSATPEQELAWFVGKALARNGYFAAAVSFLLKARDAGPTTTEASLAVAAALDASGKGAEADAFVVPLGSALVKKLESNFRYTRMNTDFAQLPSAFLSDFRAAVHEYTRENYQQALTLFRQCDRGQGTPYPVLFNLGVTYGALSQFNESVMAFTRARQITEKDTSLLLNMAASAFFGKRYGDARRMLEQILAIAPDNLRAHRSLIALESVQGEFSKALHYAQTMMDRPGVDWDDWAILIALTNRIGEVASRADAYRRLRLLFFGQTKRPSAAAVASESPKNEQPSTAGWNTLDDMELLKRLKKDLKDESADTRLNHFIQALRTSEVNFEECVEILHFFMKNGMGLMLAERLGAMPSLHPVTPACQAILAIYLQKFEITSAQALHDLLAKYAGDQVPGPCFEEAAANALASNGNYSLAATLYEKLLLIASNANRPDFLVRYGAIRTMVDPPAAQGAFKGVLRFVLSESEKFLILKKREGSLPRIESLPKRITKPITDPFEDATAALDQKRLPEAEAQLITLIKRCKVAKITLWQPYLLFNLGCTQMEQGRYVEAGRSFLESGQSAPYDLAWRSYWNAAIAALKRSPGTGKAPQDAYDAALKSSEALRRLPQTQDTARTRRRSLQSLVYLAYSCGKSSDAANYISQLLDLSPDEPYLHAAKFALSPLPASERTRKQNIIRLIKILFTLPQPFPVPPSALPPVQRTDRPENAPVKIEFHEVQEKVSQLISEGQLEEAIAYLRDRIKESPQFLSLRTLLASTLTEAGKLEEAEKEYKRVVHSSSPERKQQARMSLIHFYIQTGNRLQALDAITEMEKHHPSASGIKRLRSLAAGGSEHEPFGESELIDAFKLAKQLGQLQVRRFVDKLTENPSAAGPSAATLRILGMACDHLDEEDRALAFLKSAVSASQVPAEMIRSFQALIFTYLEWDRPEEAQAAYLDLMGRVSASKLTAKLQERISEASARSGRDPASGPNSATIRRTWKLFREAGQFEDAVRYFQDLVRIRPDLPRAYEYLAKALQATGQIEEAIQTMRRMGDRFKTGEAYCDCAAFCEETERIAEAVKAYEAALGVNPFLSICRERLHAIAPDQYPSIVYIGGTKLRDDKAARLMSNPSDSIILDTLVKDFIKHRNFELGENTFSTLLKFHPSAKEFRLAMEKLREDSPTATASALTLVQKPALHETARLDRQLQRDWTSVPEEDRNVSPKLLLDDAIKTGDQSRREKRSWQAAVVSFKSQDYSTLTEALLVYVESKWENSIAGADDSSLDVAKTALEAIIFLAAIEPKLLSEDFASRFLTTFFRACSELKRIEDIGMLSTPLREAVKLCPEEIGKLRLSRCLRYFLEGASAVSSAQSHDAISRANRLAAATRNIIIGLEAVNQVVPPALTTSARIALQTWIDLFAATSAGLSAVAELTLDVDELPQTEFNREILLKIRVLNEGTSPAQNIHINVTDGRDYVVRELPKRIDVLPGGATETVYLKISPVTGRNPFDLQLVLAYDTLQNTRPRSNFGKVIYIGDRNAHFVPPPSPYRPGTATSDINLHLFRGRDELLAAIRSEVESPSRKCQTVLYGQRRMGKTSILHKLRNYLQASCLLAYVDMSGLSAPERKTGSIFRAIALSLSQAAKLDTSSLKSETEFQSAPTLIFDEFLASFRQLFPDRPVFIMIDEFEILVRKIDQNEVDPTFFDYLRGLIQNAPQLHFMLAGAEQLLPTFARLQHPLIRQLTMRPVSFLDREAARRLVVEPSQSVGVEYDDEAVERLLNVTNGHPNYIHLLCEALISRIGLLKRTRASLGDVEATIGKFVTTVENEQHFVNLKEHSGSLSVTKVISVIAKLQQGDQTYVGRDAICHRCEHEFFNLSRPEIVQHLDTLVQREVIARRPHQDGLVEYRFTLPLYRIWLLNHQLDPLTEL